MCAFHRDERSPNQPQKPNHWLFYQCKTKAKISLWNHESHGLSKWIVMSRILVNRFNQVTALCVLSMNCHATNDRNPQLVFEQVNWLFKLVAGALRSKKTRNEPQVQSKSASRQTHVRKVWRMKKQEKRSFLVLEPVRGKSH